MIRDPVEELLDCYFKACSILIDYRDLARISSVFAHHGMNPHIGEQLFPLNLPDMSMLPLQLVVCTMVRANLH